MAFDIALLILFFILFGLILFRDEIRSFFKERAEEKREEKEEAGKAPADRRVEEHRPTPPETKPQEKHAEPKRAEEKPPRQTLPPKEEIPVSKPEPPKERVETAEKRETKTVRTIPEETKAATAKVETAKKIPQKEYADFDNSRLLAMGLSQKDADEFVLELIEQIDEFIPQIEAAIEAGDYRQVERLSHSLKGSATNLGTGGVADQLIDFNTYCKKGEDKETILNYLNSLKSYQAKLKTQYT